MFEFSRSAALVAATVTVGLAAGLFYFVAHAMMTGLARTDDRTFVSAMQSINREILNGWFAISFGGGLFFIMMAGALHTSPGGRSVLPWIVAAFVLYVVVLVITFGVNVPLNDELEAAGDPIRISDLHAVRERFEDKWVRWNIVRAGFSTAAFGCLSWALVLHGRIDN